MHIFILLLLSLILLPSLHPFPSVFHPSFSSYLFYSFLPSFLCLSTFVNRPTFLFPIKIQVCQTNKQANEMVFETLFCVGFSHITSFLHSLQWDFILSHINRNAIQLILKCHFKHLISIEMNTAELCGVKHRNVELDSNS